MKHSLVFIVVFFLTACTQSRVKVYGDMLEPRVNIAKKEEVNKLFGTPTWCTPDSGSEKCEYRTSRGSNHPVPDVYRKEDSLGPDLSPYDHFDVLHLRFDSFGILKDWEPVVIRQ